jgi:hypothetical protein
MKMHTPPAMQGQMVEISFGGDGSGTLYRRTIDRSDRSVAWACCAAEDLCDCAEECDCFDPANAEPPEPAGGWQTCAEPST